MKFMTSKQKVNQSSLLMKGFTLIELLVVMAIIATLSGIGFGVFLYMNTSAKESETETIINAVAAAMDARSADISSDQRDDLNIPDDATFPEGDGSESSTEDIVYYIMGDFDRNGVVDEGAETKLPQLSSVDSGEASFLNEDGYIVDSWGTPIRYTYKDQGGGNYSGEYHNEDNGFDLESAGPDKEFGSSSSDSLSEDNIILK